MCRSVNSPVQIGVGLLWDYGAGGSYAHCDTALLIGATSWTIQIRNPDHDLSDPSSKATQRESEMPLCISLESEFKCILACPSPSFMARDMTITIRPLA